MRLDLLPLAIIPFLSILGAWYSRKLKAGHNAFFLLMPLNGALTGASWAVMSRLTRMSLAVASVIFDAVYNLSYFFAFLAMGESITFTQALGVACVILGMVLMSI